jgi:hypothetical protein
MWKEVTMPYFKVLLSQHLPERIEDYADVAAGIKTANPSAQLESDHRTASLEMQRGLARWYRKTLKY